jgi:cold shock CspA family protein
MITCVESGNKIIKNIKIGSIHLISRLGMRGKIVFFSKQKKYGFIKTNRMQDDLYFHESNYPSRYTPHKNQNVEFKAVNTPKGYEAVDIYVLRYDE